MTKPAPVRQADLERMAAVAVEYGVCVEAEVEGMIVRVMPSGTHRTINRELTREEKAEEALAKWQASRKAKELPDDFAL